MEDYKEIIKELFLRYYNQVGSKEEKRLLTTQSILTMMQGIIPNEPIGEHDIYEVMKELNFRQELEILYDKICIFEGDKENHLPPEYEKIETGRVFKWVVYETNHGI